MKNEYFKMGALEDRDDYTPTSTRTVKFDKTAFAIIDGELRRVSSEYRSQTVHLPYSFASVTGIEIKNDNLVYVESIFPNNEVSSEFNACCLTEKDFKYLFNYVETDNTLYIQKKDEFNQLIDSFVCYQWNGKQFNINL